MMIVLLFASGECCPRYDCGWYSGCQIPSQKPVTQFSKFLSSLRGETCARGVRLEISLYVLQPTDFWLITSILNGSSRPRSFPSCGNFNICFSGGSTLQIDISVPDSLMQLVPGADLRFIWPMSIRRVGPRWRALIWQCDSESPRAAHLIVRASRSTEGARQHAKGVFWI